MTRYRYSYQMVERYTNMVADYQFLFRCTPWQTNYQRLDESNLHILSSVSINHSVDNFGNTIHYGSLKENHDIFVIASSGVVSQGEYLHADNTPNAVFRASTKLTYADGNLIKFNKKQKIKGSELEQALGLSNAVFKAMEYQGGITHVGTTASESFALGKGVCQDYSHILLSLCRLKGLYARYVAGFVEGTGETHSWIEVHCDGNWHGIDPTHNKLITKGYIKVAHGRDASDCSVIRGVRRGACHSEEIQIRVIVEEI